MKVHVDCLKCISEISAHAVAASGVTGRPLDQILAEIASGVTCHDDVRTTPEVFLQILSSLTDEIGDPDPFREWKAEQNRVALGLYPWLRELVAEADVPLNRAVLLAAIGNSLDLLGAARDLGAEQVVRERLDRPLPVEAYAEFADKLSRCRRLVFFGDNCGEVVFDRLLLETIRQDHSPDIVYVVRSVPALNDVTLEEARSVGMEAVARLVENGIIGPLPGTVLPRCSETVQALAAEADLIISKGAGNFYTLDEYRPPTDVVYLLMTKCQLHANHFGTQLLDPILHIQKKAEDGGGSRPAW